MIKLLKLVIIRVKFINNLSVTFNKNSFFFSCLDVQSLYCATEGKVLKDFSIEHIYLVASHRVCSTGHIEVITSIVSYQIGNR